MTKDNSPKKIGIFSVGTAGHVIPSVRIINELKKQGVDLKNILVVTGNRDEKKYYRKYPESKERLATLKIHISKYFFSASHC